MLRHRRRPHAAADRGGGAGVERRGEGAGDVPRRADHARARHGGALVARAAARAGRLRRRHPARRRAYARPSLPREDVSALISELGATAEVALLRDRLTAWLDTVDDEVREPLAWAFAGTPKHFRPLTLFACHRAMHGPPGADAVELAFAMELMHNMSLVIDDVLDASDERRGIDTVLRRFGSLPALMTLRLSRRRRVRRVRRGPVRDPPPGRVAAPAGVGGVPAVAAAPAAAGRRRLAADRRRGHRLDVRDLRGARRALPAPASVRAPGRRALPRMRRRRRPARARGAGRRRRGGHPRRHPHAAGGAGHPRSRDPRTVRRRR